jgi:hypothetical protein
MLLFIGAYRRMTAKVLRLHEVGQLVAENFIFGKLFVGLW